MSKRYYLLLLLLSGFDVFASCATCTTPTPGQSLWTIAADALVIMCSIESKLSQLIPVIETDFDGTFTVIGEIVTVACSSETLVESINSNLDQLLVSFDTTLEKLAVVTSKTALLLTDVELLSVDLLATFTALDELKNNIGSKLDVLAKDLQLIESDVQLLIQTEIDQQITVVSHLNVLQSDVDLLNAALDSLSIIEGINQMSSSVAIVSSLTDRIEINVNNLQDLLQTDFSGTWTALNSQLMLACTVESLVDALQLTQMTDFSGVFTSLAALQQTIHEIDSMVDITSIVNSKDLTCSIESKIDIALSKLSIAQQQLLPLPTLGQSIINLLASDVEILDNASSALDITIELLLLIDSAIDTIISKVSVIEGGLLTNSSNLEVVVEELLTINSVLDNFAATVSDLESIDSKLEEMNLEAITIESLVDLINGQIVSIDSKIDVFQLISKSEVIASELATIPSSLVTISSKLDLVIIAENTINSELDNIINESQSSLSLLSIIDSKVLAIESMLDLASGIVLTSKLAVIEDQACTISSKMVIVDDDIVELIFIAQDLVTDFQETWTILDSISNILMADQLGLQTISSKLSNLNLPVDLSGVYTVINSIIVQEVTVNTQVDTYNSLVDALGSIIPTDFNGVFTTLNQVSTGLVTINSQVDLMNSHVNTLETYFGIPIYNRDVGTTGYVITQPGRYYLAEDIIFTPTLDYSSAIYLSGIDDVTLDLNGQSLQQSSNSSAIASGIYVTHANNIRLQNGFLNNFYGGNGSILPKSSVDGVISLDNVSNILIDGLNITNTRSSASDVGNSPQGIRFLDIFENVVCKNCFFDNIIGSGFSCDYISATPASTNKNILLKNSFFNRCGNPTVFGAAVITNAVRNVCIENVTVYNSQHGILCYLNTNVAISNSICNSAAIAGIRLLGEHPNSLGVSQNGDIRNCIANYGQGSGIILGSTNLSSVNFQGCTVMNNTVIGNLYGINVYREGNPQPTLNNYIAFNSLINNNINMAETADTGTTGPNSILGNFAFNSTAVGNPNNTNYSLSDSVITNKFMTISQTGSIGDYVTGWHNINMLP